MMVMMMIPLKENINTQQMSAHLPPLLLVFTKAYKSTPDRLNRRETSADNIFSTLRL